MSNNDINNLIKKILTHCDELKKQIPSDISDNDLFINNDFIMLSYNYERIRKLYMENKNCLDDDTIKIIREKITIE